MFSMWYAQTLHALWLASVRPRHEHCSIYCILCRYRPKSHQKISNVGKSVEDNQLFCINSRALSQPSDECGYRTEKILHISALQILRCKANDNSKVCSRHFLEFFQMSVLIFTSSQFTLPMGRATKTVYRLVICSSPRKSLVKGERFIRAMKRNQSTVIRKQRLLKVRNIHQCQVFNDHIDMAKSCHRLLTHSVAT